MTGRLQPGQLIANVSRPPWIASRLNAGSSFFSLASVVAAACAVEALRRDQDLASLVPKHWLVADEAIERTGPSLRQLDVRSREVIELVFAGSRLRIDGQAVMGRGFSRLC